METREFFENENKTSLIEEYADIYQLPEVRPSSANTVLIGDLHANAIKLLYFLIREGILELDPDPSKYPESIRNKIAGDTKALYRELVKIYEKDADHSNNTLADILEFADLYVDIEKAKAVYPEFSQKDLADIDKYVSNRSNIKETYLKTIAPQLEKEDLDFFKAALANARIVNKRRIMLIGDEFFDRGKNDYFTLEIIRKLKDESVPYEILLSNHGAELYGVFNYVNQVYTSEEEKQERLKEAREARHPSPKDIKTILGNFERNMTRLVFNSTCMDTINDQSASAHNLGALIKRGLVSDDEVESLIKDCCFPNLKIFSYIETEDGRLGICSHAPVGFETIEGMAKALGVKFDDNFQNNPEAIKGIIDQINNRFQQALSIGLTTTNLLSIGANITDNTDGRLRKDQLRSIELESKEAFESYREHGFDLGELAYFFYRTTWNRFRDEVNRPDNPNIFWINGHDKKPINQNHPFEICLDNDCGKKLSDRVQAGFEFNKMNQQNSLIKANNDPEAIQLFCRAVLQNKETAPEDQEYAKNLLAASFLKKPLTKPDLLFVDKILRLKTIKFATEIAQGKFLSLNQNKELKDDAGKYIVLRLNEKGLALKNEPYANESSDAELQQRKKSLQERRAKLNARKEELARLAKEESYVQHSMWRKDNDNTNKKEETEVDSEKQPTKQEKNTP